MSSQCKALSVETEKGNSLEHSKKLNPNKMRELGIQMKEYGVYFLPLPMFSGSVRSQQDSEIRARAHCILDHVLRTPKSASIVAARLLSSVPMLAPVLSSAVPHNTEGIENKLPCEKQQPPWILSCADHTAEVESELHHGSLDLLLILHSETCQGL